MQELGNAEIFISIKERLTRQLAFAVGIISADIPTRIAAISIFADVIRDVRDYKLGFGDAIALIILEMVIE